MMVVNRSDSKRRRKEEQNVLQESPKRAKVHAQRKFAQGSSTVSSPALTPVKDKVKVNGATPSAELLPAKRPNTEDFLTFLCFRGTGILPTRLDFFKTASLQEQQDEEALAGSSSGVAGSSRGNSKQDKHNSDQQSSLAEVKQTRNNKQPTSAQDRAAKALRKKYQEQRLAKQKKTTTSLTKLVHKVKGKNTEETRAAVRAAEIENKRKRNSRVLAYNKARKAVVAATSRVKPTLKRSRKHKNKQVRVGLRSGGQLPPGSDLGLRNPKRKPRLTSPSSSLREREVHATAVKEKEVLAARVKVRLLSSPEKRILVKAGKERVSTKPIASSLSDFSSDDDQPLVKKSRSTSHQHDVQHASKASAQTGGKPRQTRSKQPVTAASATSLSSRPSRKTKEAAALYMEMLGKDLRCPDEEYDDDTLSVESFPELPNTKKTELREKELKALAEKNATSKEEPKPVKRVKTEEVTVNKKDRVFEMANNLKIDERNRRLLLRNKARNKFLKEKENAKKRKVLMAARTVKNKTMLKSKQKLKENLTKKRKSKIPEKKVQTPPQLQTSNELKKSAPSVPAMEKVSPRQASSRIVSPSRKSTKEVTTPKNTRISKASSERTTPGLELTTAASERTTAVQQKAKKPDTDDNYSDSDEEPLRNLTAKLPKNIKSMSVEKKTCNTKKESVVESTEESDLKIEQTLSDNNKKSIKQNKPKSPQRKVTDIVKKEVKMSTSLMNKEVDEKLPSATVNIKYEMKTKQITAEPNKPENSESIGYADDKSIDITKKNEEKSNKTSITSSKPSDKKIPKSKVAAVEKSVQQITKAVETDKSSSELNLKNLAPESLSTSMTKAHDFKASGKQTTDKVSNTKSVDLKKEPFVGRSSKSKEKSIEPTNASKVEKPIEKELEKVKVNSPSIKTTVMPLTTKVTSESEIKVIEEKKVDKLAVQVIQNECMSTGKNVSPIVRDSNNSVKYSKLTDPVETSKGEKVLKDITVPLPVSVEKHNILPVAVMTGICQNTSKSSQSFPKNDTLEVIEQVKPTCKTDVLPVPRIDVKTDIKSVVNADPELKTDIKFNFRTDIKQECQPANKTDVKPTAQTDIKPVVKPENVPGNNSHILPVVKNNIKPIVKSDFRPIAKTDVKPAVETNFIPILNADVKPGTKLDFQPILQSDVTHSLKHDVKLINQVPVKLEVKSEVQMQKCIDSTPMYKTPVKARPDPPLPVKAAVFSGHQGMKETSSNADKRMDGITKSRQSVNETWRLAFKNAKIPKPGQSSPLPSPSQPFVRKPFASQALKKQIQFDDKRSSKVPSPTKTDTATAPASSSINSTIPFAVNRKPFLGIASTTTTTTTAAAAVNTPESVAIATTETAAVQEENIIKPCMIDPDIIRLKEAEVVEDIVRRYVGADFEKAHKELLIGGSSNKDIKPVQTTSGPILSSSTVIEHGKQIITFTKVIDPKFPTPSLTTIPQQLQPTVPQQVQPTVPQQLQPNIPQQVQPTLLQQVQSIVPQLAQTTVPQLAQPTIQLPLPITDLSSSLTIDKTTVANDPLQNSSPLKSNANDLPQNFSPLKSNLPSAIPVTSDAAVSGGKHQNLPLAVEQTLKKLGQTKSTVTRKPVSTVQAKHPVEPLVQSPMKKPPPYTPRDKEPVPAPRSDTFSIESTTKIDLLNKKKVNMSAEEINKWLNDSTSAGIEHAKDCGIFEKNQCECGPSFVEDKNICIEPEPPLIPLSTEKVEIKSKLPKPKTVPEMSPMIVPNEIKQISKAAVATDNTFVRVVADKTKQQQSLEKINCNNKQLRTEISSIGSSNVNKSVSTLPVTTNKNLTVPSPSFPAPPGQLKTNLKDDDNNKEVNRNAYDQLTALTNTKASVKVTRGTNKIGDSEQENSSRDPSEVSSPPPRDDISSNDESPEKFVHPERRSIFHQRRSAFRMKPPISRSPSAFSPENESSVYAFEPDLPPTSTPFRRTKSAKEGRPSSTTTDEEEGGPSSNSIAVQVNFDTEAVLECSTQTEADDDDSEGHLFYIPLQQNTAESTGGSPQLIQGVAVKLGTEGPDQRVIMRAKLVTKPPATFTSSSASRPLVGRRESIGAGAKPEQKVKPLTVSNIHASKPPVGTVQPTARVTTNTSTDLGTSRQMLPQEQATSDQSNTVSPSASDRTRKESPGSMNKMTEQPVLNVDKKGTPIGDANMVVVEEKSELSDTEKRPLDNKVQDTRTDRKSSPVPDKRRKIAPAPEVKSKKASVAERISKALPAPVFNSKTRKFSPSAEVKERKTSERNMPSTSSKQKRTKGKGAGGAFDSSGGEGFANLKEAPSFYPTEKEFLDPLEYIDKIRPLAEKFGLCKVIPPPNFKPECKVSDDMRFTAYNQLVHKMMHRWGPNVKEMLAIKKYLATQSISLTHPPWIGGMEVDLPKLYQTVQICGGLKEVIEKKRWTRVADAMRIPKSAQDRVTKLDDIYCKFLLPYDTLSHAERTKLFEDVETEWEKRMANDKDNETESSSDDNGDLDECIIKGRNMALNAFYRIARNTMAVYFRNQDQPPANEVESEFWNHVATRQSHVCVHSGSIDSGAFGYGFPIVKNSSTARHPWNLKVLTNNVGSILRSLGPLMGVTVPTLHVGMVFSACCWYRDPHGLPWIEYLHTGASKIWYGIPDESSNTFREAMVESVPRLCRDKTIWLASDTAMVPPHLLVNRGVSLCRTVQHPGQFIIVFPKAFTSSICTGYLVSESVYFAQPTWLTTAQSVFKDISDSSEPSMFSLERLLFSIASDSRSHLDILSQVLPMVDAIKERELEQRAGLEKLGLTTTERLPLNKSGRGKSRLAHDDDGDYECEICRANLFLSLVTNSHEEGVYCLRHAIQLLTSKPADLKYYSLLYTYSSDEFDDLIEKIKSRIELKSQKKLQSKPHSSAAGSSSALTSAKS